MINTFLISLLFCGEKTSICFYGVRDEECRCPVFLGKRGADEKGNNEVEEHVT